MFVKLNGVVDYFNKDFVCLNVNGIGFQIFINRINELVVGDTSSFFISDYIKDEKIILYGFKTEKELLMFNKLLTVNGVGCKTAISILKSLSVDELIYLIKNKKVKEISSIFSVGNKASSIVFELENKLNDFETNYIYKFENVYEALIRLGYKSATIRKTLADIDDSIDENEAIKIALKNIKNYE